MKKMSTITIRIIAGLMPKCDRPDVRKQLKQTATKIIERERQTKGVAV